MDLGLQGKVAIVTGGSEGIGKAAAASMAAEGASVLIAARRVDVLEAAATEIREQTGGNVTAVPTDVMDPEQVESLIQRAVDDHGRLDILVNNAGTSAGGAFLGVTDEAWQHDLDLKLYGSIRTSRLAVPLMRQQSGGRIINVTNLGAKAPGAASVPTSVSRAAGVALTKAMSKEFAADNILSDHRLHRPDKERPARNPLQCNAGKRPRYHTRPVLRRHGRSRSDRARWRVRGGRRRDSVPRIRAGELPDRHRHQHRRRNFPRSLALLNPKNTDSLPFPLAVSSFPRRRESIGGGRLFYLLSESHQLEKSLLPNAPRLPSLP